ncbi:hypothetical protein B566_EDAN017172 [Ephemera danica]|nr:hypothetical protein B566_EDAN017172 [Ephemera danica]
MPGRKEDKIKRYYNLINGKEKCVFCGKKYAHNIEHMTNHIQYLCKKATENARSYATELSNCKTDKQRRKLHAKLNKISKFEKKQEYSSSSGLGQSGASSSGVSDSNSCCTTPTPGRSNKLVRYADPDLQATTPTGLQQTKTQPKIDNVFENLQERQATFKRDFATAVFATDYLLSMVDADEWQTFFKKHLPSLPLPTRYEMSGQLLDDCHAEVSDHVNTKIAEAQTVGLQMDGWENVKRTSILHVVATTPEPVLLESIASGVSRHTGEYMAEKLSEIIESIGPEKVLGGVTDGAAAMLKTRELLKKKYGHMHFFTCADHGLNNYLKDIIAVPCIGNIVCTCNSISQDVLRSTLLLAWFTDLQAERITDNTAPTLKAPGNTRFASNSFVLKSVQANKSCLRHMVIEDHPTKPTLRMSTKSQAAVVTKEFWNELEAVNDYFNILAKWITLLGSDTPRCDLVVEAFNEADVGISKLRSSITNMSGDVENMMRNFLKKRHSMVVTKLHYSANLLNPKLRGQHLTKSEHEAAFEFVETFAQQQPSFSENDVLEVVTELGNFKAESDYFANSYVKSSSGRMEPMNWWKGICSCTKLSDVATKILAMPPTSSATERSFSTAGHIHCKKRNRLTTERAAKLTFIKHNLKLLKANDKKCVNPLDKSRYNHPSSTSQIESEEEYYSESGSGYESEESDTSDCSVHTASSLKSKTSESASLMSTGSGEVQVITPEVSTARSGPEEFHEEVEAILATAEKQNLI